MKSNPYQVRPPSNEAERPVTGGGQGAVEFRLWLLIDAEGQHFSGWISSSKSRPLWSEEANALCYYERREEAEEDRSRLSRLGFPVDLYRLELVRCE